MGNNPWLRIVWAASFVLFQSSYIAAVEINPAGARDPFIVVMDGLDSAVRQIVSAVIIGDGKKVLEAIEAINEDAVYSAVTSGTYKPKKNAEKREEFNNLEKEFHGRLHDLRDAAANNNWELMVSETNSIIAICARCHQQFKI